ncbi:MAG: cytochrome-c oxidase, cbb3-type subunit III [Pseudomonadota bacterium]
MPSEAAMPDAPGKKAQGDAAGHNHEVKIDEPTGVETTGHSWDGVEELNNPLPRWWVSVFYATIIWSIGYAILYPAWPMLTTSTKGLLGWSTRGEVAAALSAVEDARAPWRDKIAAAPLENILTDAELVKFARRAGGAAFTLHCAQCHGSDAQGAVGYPNLNDDDWLWGGTLEEIHHTIAHGVRNDDSDQSHFSEMPVFREILSSSEIDQVTHHVMSLGGLPHDAALAGKGSDIFLDNCASCHGDAGGGDIYLGAPNLADVIWLFGDDEASIASQIANPVHGQMPAWGPRLDEVTIKELAVYVHTLGGGK